MRPHLPFLNIKVEGSQIPKEALEDLIECCIDQSLHVPDACTIRLDDHEFKWLDSGDFREGKEIDVEGGMEGEGGLLPLFNGEITAIELDMAAMGMPSISIRCMSYLHRFHRGRFQRSFVQSTHEDIVKKIASELGFSVESDSTTPVFDWVFQNNQTNWEFINMLAGRNGFRVFATSGKKLHFKKVTDGSDGELKLEWSDALRSFRPRVAASHQVDQVVVQGWDPKAKQAIMETASDATGVPQVGETAQGGDVAKKAFGQAKLVVVDRPVQSAQEASSLAQSIFDEVGGSFLEADGLCHAKPQLKPGMNVNIANIGKRFSGKYFVTSTIQTYTPSEGFVTQFGVTGKKPSNLLSLMQNRDLAHKTQLGGNVVVGIVTNNQDPDDLGRVKVKYPWLSQDHESFWVRLVTPMAGPGRGIEFIPEVDDEVLVAFEHGDIHRPFLLGAVWNGVDKPVEPNSKAVQGGKVQRRTVKTRIGHFQLFDDTDGKGEMSWTTSNANRLALDDANQNITLKTTNGHTVVLDDQNKNITIKTTNGHTVLLDDQGSKIYIQDMTGSNTVTINSNDNSMSFVCLGDFNVNATGQVSITGQQGITMSTPMQLQASGDMGATLQSSMNVTIQGMMVNIN